MVHFPASAMFDDTRGQLESYYQWFNYKNYDSSNSDSYWLVVSPPLKNMKVHWDDYFQYVGK